MKLVKLLRPPRGTLSIPENLIVFFEPRSRSPRNILIAIAKSRVRKIFGVASIVVIWLTGSILVAFSIKSEGELGVHLNQSGLLIIGAAFSLTTQVLVGSTIKTVGHLLLIALAAFSILSLAYHWIVGQLDLWLVFGAVPLILLIESFVVSQFVREGDYTADSSGRRNANGSQP